MDQYIYIKYLDYIKDYADRFSSEEESTFEFFSEKIMFSSRKSIGDLYYLDDVLYDLPMIGAERLDIEFLYEINRGKEAPEMVNLDGVFLKDENGDLINLLERFDEEIVKKNRNRRKDKTLKLHGGDYFPAGGLPEGYEIGVRPKNLSEFEQSLSDDSEEFTDIQYLLLVANMLDLVTSKAKKWTQGDLAASISDKKIKGIGERTINGIFAKANSLNKSIG
ncbi:hypothetical protein ACSILF_002973 [Yersinia enterocolitica]|nr:hypothetical protein [Yersinia enterocolitica]